MAELSAIKHKDKVWPQSIVECAARFRDGSLTVEALTSRYLEGIRSLQSEVNAFITVTETAALEEARKLDRELKSGMDRGPLHGIPIVYKDNFDTAGVVTTVGSELFRERIPTRSSTVAARLGRSGVVMLGKTTMNEFAAGASGRNKAFGNVHNPWDLSRTPGGSSSGTGAAIAAGLCLAGTGTDTGGSIRIPASWCGISGIRPSFGRVSVAGVYPRAYSLDTAGPLARTVEDLALMLNSMAGFDPADSRSVQAPDENFAESLGSGIRGLRLGIIDDYSFRQVDTDVSAAVSDAISALERLGAKVTTVKIPQLVSQLDYMEVLNIVLSEFSEIFGWEGWSPDQDLPIGPDVKTDLVRAKSVPSQKYAQSLQSRNEQIKEFRTVFSKVDALITPTMPTVAPLLTTELADFDRARQFTLPFGFLGVPAVSIPCGFGAHHMPIGLQIIGDQFKEALLLRIGHTFQKSSDHHLRNPPVFWAG